MASAKKLPSGSWRVNLYAGKDNAGKRIYKSFTADTKKEAEYLAAQYALTRKEKADPANMTVGEAIDRYIEAKSNILSPSTITAYRKIRKNNFQGIMNVPLGDLTQEHVQIAVNIESASHSPKTVRNQHGLLAASLAAYLPEFALHTKFPQRVKPGIQIPDNAMIASLMNAVKGKPIELPIVLGACMGLRRSEISALSANDYDPQRKMLTINKAMVETPENLWVVKHPKTYSGMRALPVPDSVIPMLLAARFPMPTPDQITKQFATIKKQLGFNIRFHDLRHYYASVLLAIGIPDKYAMERMGHATPNMLKTVYQHTMQDKQKEVTDSINQAISKVMQHEMQHESKNPQ